jgi:hypothetical protein
MCWLLLGYMQRFWWQQFLNVPESVAYLWACGVIPRRSHRLFCTVLFIECFVSQGVWNLYVKRSLVSHTNPILVSLVNLINFLRFVFNDGPNVP